MFNIFKKRKPNLDPKVQTLLDDIEAGDVLEYRAKENHTYLALELSYNRKISITWSTRGDVFDLVLQGDMVKIDLLRTPIAYDHVIAAMQTKMEDHKERLLGKLLK